MAFKNRLDAVKELVGHKKLKDAYLEANQITIDHINEIIKKYQDSIDNRRFEGYKKLKKTLKKEESIPKINQKKYRRSLVIRILSGIAIFSFFIGIIFLFKIEWILVLGILVPVILFYITLFLFEEKRVKFQQPEGWILEISKLEDQLSSDFDYVELERENIKLELLNAYRFWIISMKKYGYLVLDD
ncbi:MAG: hypothetical protein GF329_12445 [Candidatus Lokiarchaeota archaeon]|nr:hypothetical protein [Candidatus Lokiarchaeota archaeon]